MVNSSMSIEDLIPDEQSAVKELRQRMAGHMDQEMFDDINVFVRFLRARDLNLNAAEAMLRKHLEWRKSIQMENILVNYTPKEVVEKYVTADFIGMDKEGTPIFFLNFGQIDTRGLLKCSKKGEIVKCIVQRIERAIKVMQKQSQKVGKLIDQWIIIANFDKLPLSTATHKGTLETAAHLIVTYESNYPERMKAGYAINASAYFMMGWSVVKHFVSPKTYNKIRFFGRDGWKEELLKFIDPEVLPAFLGGTRTDPDGNPLCKTIVTHGGLVPESYYVKKHENTLSNLPDTKRLIVTRMSKAQITLGVTESGSHIEWEFETTSRDIAFSILYKQSEHDYKTEELIPKQRIETDISSEAGMVKCPRPGIYIIEFDNSYSWIFQKEVYYKISVVKDSILLD